jgi:multiple sugar transport system ATP-binding protein
VGFPLKMIGTPAAEIARAVVGRRRKSGSAICCSGHRASFPADSSSAARWRAPSSAKPRLFLLDEPLSNLDAKLRLETRLELHALQRALGATTVYVTHDQEEAMTLADRIAVFMEGRIVQIGTPREVFTRPRTMDVAAFIGTPPMNLLRGAWSDSTVVVEGTSLPVGKATTTGREVTLGVRPNDMRIAAAGLPARVERIEDLGDSCIVSFHRGEQLLKMKSDKLQGVREGEDVFLGFAPDAAHLFDLSTGARL